MSEKLNKQNKTKQNKTKQNKTKQNKTNKQNTIQKDKPNTIYILKVLFQQFKTMRAMCSFVVRYKYGCIRSFQDQNITCFDLFLGLMTIQTKHQIALIALQCALLYYFTLSNARQFYLLSLISEQSNENCPLFTSKYRPWVLLQLSSIRTDPFDIFGCLFFASVGSATPSFLSVLIIQCSHYNNSIFT
jgi:hypothetical protein